MPAATEQRRSIKAGLDGETARRQRAESKVELRKAKKDDTLLKRRNLTMLPAESTSEGQFSPRVDDVETLAEKTLGYMREGWRAEHMEAATDTVRQLRKLLSLERLAPIDDCINSGLVPAFVQLLSHPSSPMAFEAAWCVTNIASGSAKQCKAVVDGGAITPLVSLLSNVSMEVKEQAIWALGNIAGDCPQFRDMVIAECGIQPLLEIIAECAQSGLMSVLRNATWVLSNLMRGKPAPRNDLVAPAVPTLINLLSIEDEEVLTDTCWALSYLSDGDNASIDLVASTGAVSLLMPRMQYCSEKVATPALRTMCNILTGSDDATQSVLDAKFLQFVPAVLGASKSRIRKEACWALSNIAAGSPAQVKALMEATGVMQLVIERLGEDEFEVKKEAAWAIANVFHAFRADKTALHASYVQACVQYGVITPLVALLDVNDTAVQKLVLDAVFNMLAAGEMMATKGGANPFLIPFDEAGGIDKLEALQTHDNTEVYNKAVEVLDAYFGEDNDEDENLAPNATANSFVFGMPQNGQRVNAPLVSNEQAAPQFAF
eukprot:CAMPEP_0183342072 /NCGR_PEP_ID=MMETSP0164_2-20130417/8233_1 /TAXON_ID=221442 /ORGANISM="Coccolithus pelagicus ssp braarudi, Strain PLY182g" /LENGTH=546 /DNA_ID=CAMNT_0025512555 /DNA_START=58 /DNA_END=1698 /DNA_ORIENTATION=+